MAFLFTLAYLLTAFLTPPVLFGSLAPYHLEVITALLAAATSAPAILRSGILRQPQTLAIGGLLFAIMTSSLLGLGVSTILTAFYDFLPIAFAFLLVGVNCRTEMHLRLIVLAMVASCGYFIYLGYQDLQAGVVPSLYLYGDGSLRRLRGLGFVNDPNDFSQVMVSLVPMVFLLRRKGSVLVSLFSVGIPLAILLFGMYLTHSRGAAVAMMAVVLVSSRRKLGTVPAGLVAGLLFAGSLALGWSGGRDVSMEAGADRLDAWSVGLGMIRSHPLFGVGSGRFTDFNDITAHNTIIVCAAEIGLVGFIFWTLFVFTTIRTGLRLGAPLKASPPDGEAASKDPEAGRVRAAGVGALATPRAGVAALAAAGVGAPMVAVGTGPALAAGKEDGWAKLTSSMRRDRAAAEDQGRPKAKLVSAQQRGLVAPAGWQPAGASAASAAPLAPGNRLRKALNNLDDDDVRRLARLVTYAITGFLTAGWFLSRALSMWLFEYGGMMYMVFRLGRERGMPEASTMRISFLLRWSTIIAVSLLLLVYVTLRIRSALGR